MRCLKASTILIHRHMSVCKKLDSSQKINFINLLLCCYDLQSAARPELGSQLGAVRDFNLNLGFYLNFNFILSWNGTNKYKLHSTAQASTVSGYLFCISIHMTLNKLRADI